MGDNDRGIHFSCIPVADHFGLRKHPSAAAGPVPVNAGAAGWNGKCGKMNNSNRAGSGLLKIDFRGLQIPSKIIYLIGK